MEDSVNDFGAFRDARLFDEDLDQEDDEWVGVTNLSLDVPEVSRAFHTLSPSANGYP